jgi:arabinofuranan 3-O-arabinosyltransferase
VTAVADAVLAPAVGDDIRVLPGSLEPPPSRRRLLLARATAHRTGLSIGGAGGFVAFCVFALWFRTGEFYARGDVAPFVRDSLRSEFGWQWTHQNSGAGGATYELVRVVELFFLDLAHLLGGGDALGQRLLFAAIFAFAASGVAAFAFRFVDRAWVAFVAGVLGAFGPLSMVNLPNFLVPVCIGIVAWSGALTVDAARGVKARARTLAVISAAVAYLALNPPLLAVAFAWCLALPFLAAACSGTGRAGVVRSLRFLGRTACWAVPLALWWVVPYVFAMRIATSTGTINATTDVASWSWTHAHGSFDRVLALVAKWSWPDAKFGSNGSALASPSWLWLASALPMGFVAAPLVARRARRRAALWILTIVLVLAFVGKGLNAPARGLNAAVYHLPAAWLLREPMSKVGTLMVPLALVSWALTVDGLLGHATRIRHQRPWLRAVAVLLVAAPLAFALPMITGAVVQPSDRVAVPKAWHQVARIVDDAPLPGKALVLPLDDFYQVPTTWGFYGTDTMPTQLMTRPTIVRNPQSYIGAAGDFDELVRAVQTGIVGGDPGAVPGALRALGVSYVVVRRDIDHSSPIRAVDMPEPDAINSGLSVVSGVRRIARTAVADVFEFSQGSEPVEVLSGTVAAPGAHGGALATLVASAPEGTAVATTDPARAPLLRGESWYVDVNHSSRIAPPHPGDWQYQRRASGAPLLELRPDDHGLVLREPVSIKVAGTPLATRPDQSIAGTGRSIAAKLDGAVFDLTHGTVYARVAPGASVTSYSAGDGHRLGAWGALGDCNHYDGLDATHAGLGMTTIPTPSGIELHLRAAHHSACVSAPLAGVGPGDILHVALAQRAVMGAAPRTCLWQSEIQTCAALTWSATRHGDWYNLTALYRVPAAVHHMKFFVYADQPGAGAGRNTEVWYRSVAVDRLVPGDIRIVRPTTLPAGQVHLDAASVPITTSFEETHPTLGPVTAVGDCARVDDRTLGQVGIDATFVTGDPTAVRLSARHHVACVARPVFGLTPAVTYELSFTGTVERGSQPRVCLWEDSVQGCARLAAVAVPASGRGVFRYRGSIDANPSAVRLYLYADASSDETTINYANVDMRVITDESLVLRPASMTVPSAPAVTWHRDGPARYRVNVQDARGPFVLALADAFSRDWRVRGLPAHTEADQVEIDGYRNGWVIDARGDLALTIEYAPARYGRDAMHVSQLALVALLVSLPLGPTVVRRRRRWLARRAQLRREGPRRIALPDAWPEPRV